VSDPTPVPVTIRGTTYPSQAAAARALGISVQAVHDALNRGRIDYAGLGRNWWHSRPDPNAKPEP